MCVPERLCVSDSRALSREGAVAHLFTESEFKRGPFDNMHSLRLNVEMCLSEDHVETAVVCVQTWCVCGDLVSVCGERVCVCGAKV